MNPAFPKLSGTGNRSKALQKSVPYSISTSGKMSRAFTDNINSFNVSNNFTFTAADDESKIMAWLSPLEPQVRHQDICNQRVNDIGGWLLETEEFINWYNESDNAALFCYGNPGVGKSYIWCG